MHSHVLAMQRAADPAGQAAYRAMQDVAWDTVQDYYGKSSVATAQPR